MTIGKRKQGESVANHRKAVIAHRRAQRNFPGYQREIPQAHEVQKLLKHK